MSELYWPGDERAGELLTDLALLRAMVAVESAWLAELVDAGIAPPDSGTDLAGAIDHELLAVVRRGAESAGNPAGPLVAVLRERLGDSHPHAARWLHRGLTSQDVVDTALMLCAGDVDARLRVELGRQLRAATDLARAHRSTPMVARTLTQHAIPYRFGAKVATWLTGLCDAADDLVRADRARPAQFGGAAGTLAATVELLAASGADDPAAGALALAERAAARLGLAAAPPWHTARAPVTRLGHAWVGLTNAFGRIADDVLVLARPEIGELAEPAGRGGSSTMPHKANPILSVLVRRAALAAPALGAQLDLAAATAVDERPDGGWHLEWSALQILGRRTVVAAAQLADVLEGLQVFPDRMAADLAAGGDGVHAEQRSMAALSGTDPAPGYEGATGLLVDAACRRGESLLEELG